MKQSSPMTFFAAVDESDLKLAARELEGARETLIAAHAIADRRDRGEAIKTAVGKLALSSRAIMIVVARRGEVATCDHSVCDEDGNFPALAE